MLLQREHAAQLAAITAGKRVVYISKYQPHGFYAERMSVRMSMLKCPVCGTENKAGSKFCSECGMPLGSGNVESRESRESPETAATKADEEEIPETSGKESRPEASSGSEAGPEASLESEAGPEASSGSEAGPEASSGSETGPEASSGSEAGGKGSRRNRKKINSAPGSMKPFENYEMDGRIRNYRWTTLEKKKISEEKSAQAEVAAIHRLAILSLILGIISLVTSCFCIGGFIGIPAVIVGAAQLKKGLSGSDKGMSLAGVILGICGILLALGMLVYAVISEP